MAKRRIYVAGVQVIVKDQDNMGESLGEYQHSEFEPPVILLNSTLAADVKRQTLCHELLHCVLDITGWSELLTHDQEEGLVRMLEKVFLPAWDDAQDLLE